MPTRRRARSRRGTSTSPAERSPTGACSRGLPTRTISPTARPSTAKAATGARSTAAGRWCASRRAARRVPAAGALSDDVRLRRLRLEDAVRDERAAAARRRGARTFAAVRRRLRDALRCGRDVGAEIRGLAPATTMPFDPASYIRLSAPNSLGLSASGGAFATSTGDVFEVACYGPGAFRIRVGPNTKPDYGFILGRAQRCEAEQTDPGAWSFTTGSSRLELVGEPLAFRLLQDGKPLLGSITDEHFRGFPRLPVIGRQRSGAQWTCAFALASGEPVYGLGEKFGPLNKRGQLVHSQVEDALGVNTDRSYKNVPFCWSPGTGAGAWGVFVNTPGRVLHGVGHPEWSHRSYALVVDDEALDWFLIAGRDPAQIIERYTHLTGRAPDVPLWGLGLWVSKAYYRTP